MVYHAVIAEPGRCEGRHPYLELPTDLHPTLRLKPVTNQGGKAFQNHTLNIAGGAWLSSKSHQVPLSPIPFALSLTWSEKAVSTNDLS